MTSKAPVPNLMRDLLKSVVAAIVLALFLRLFVISAYKIPTGSMAPTLKVGDFIFAYKLPYGVPIPFSNGLKWPGALPERGDVVVFRYPGNESVNYVKRVVGLPGDRISIQNRKLFINEQEAEYVMLSEDVIQDLPGKEYYAAFQEKILNATHRVIKIRAPDRGPDRSQSRVDNRTDGLDAIEDAGDFGPVIVPQGHIFVLGDNRDSSDDSRYWGTVPVRNLEGRVVMVWMSLDWLNRWGGDRYPKIRWDRVLEAVR